MNDQDDFSKHENAERILRVGWELFHKKGYRGVSVDEICQECHLTKPTLYYYFQNKENLYVQVLLHRLRDFRKTIEQPGTLAVRLKRLLLVMFETTTPNMPGLVHDMENIQDPTYHRRIAEAFQVEILEPLTLLMQSGIDAGELGPNNPRFYVWLYLGMLSPFIAHFQTDIADHPVSARLHRRMPWAGAHGRVPDMDMSHVVDKLVEFFLKGAK